MWFLQLIVNQCLKILKTYYDIYHLTTLVSKEVVNLDFFRRNQIQQDTHNDETRNDIL